MAEHKVERETLGSQIFFRCVTCTWHGSITPEWQDMVIGVHIEVARITDDQAEIDRISNDVLDSLNGASR